MDELKEILRGFHSVFWKQTVEHLDVVWEIRIIQKRPIVLRTRYGEFFLKDTGEWTTKEDIAWKVERAWFEKLLEIFCKDSIYAYQERLGQGYFTLPGGHRVGTSGEVLFQGNKLCGMKYVTSMNVRISHSVEYDIGPIWDFLKRREEMPNLLLLSPPGAGKTTCLRSLIKALSEGDTQIPGKRVAVVDERMELAGGCFGEWQHDLGLRTDVLEGCPKALGMEILIRSMSPEVVAVDELGTREDFFALEEASRCGVAVVATMHGTRLEQLKRKLMTWDRTLEDCFTGVFLLTREDRKKPGQGMVYRAEEIWSDDSSDRGNMYCDRYFWMGSFDTTKSKNAH